MTVFYDHSAQAAVANTASSSVCQYKKAVKTEQGTHITMTFQCLRSPCLLPISKVLLIIARKRSIQPGSKFRSSPLAEPVAPHSTHYCISQESIHMRFASRSNICPVGVNCCLMFISMSVQKNLQRFIARFLIGGHVVTTKQCGLKLQDIKLVNQHGFDGSTSQDSAYKDFLT